jgi:hypothetical protein
LSVEFPNDLLTFQGETIKKIGALFPYDTDYFFGILDKEVEQEEIRNA